MQVSRWQKYTHELSASFLEKSKAHKGCKNKTKKMMTDQDFLVEG